MAKIGIVVDNYKLEKFKKELTDNGFTDLTVIPFIKGTSTIQVITTMDKVIPLKRICQRMELVFNRSN